MSENMVERVAIAICEAMDVMDGLDLAVATKYARAAIEAMREPTELMHKAGYRYIDHVGVGEVWSAMIDAALKEEPDATP